MGQRLIITEEEKTSILSLYEQAKPIQDIKSLIGKTFNLYSDSNNNNLLEFKKSGYKFTTLGPTVKILNISNDSIGQQLIIELDNDSSISQLSNADLKGQLVLKCKYNPDQYENGGYLDYGPLWENKYHINAYPSKQFLNHLNTNFNFCKKPKADFGVNDKSSDTDKMV
jgi:hypothetical protein